MNQDTVVNLASQAMTSVGVRQLAKVLLAMVLETSLISPRLVV